MLSDEMREQRRQLRKKMRSLRVAIKHRRRPAKDGPKPVPGQYEVEKAYVDGSRYHQLKIEAFGRA